MAKKVKYKIKEVLPSVFSVTIPNDFERAMTFLRVQEFYESPNPIFRGNNFNIWDFFEWYSLENQDSFTYGKDWSGFNVPFEVAWKCYSGVGSLPDSHKSKWDETMKSIVWTVQARMFNKKNKDDHHAYIIGSKDTEGETFKHELCHSLYYVNEDYKREATALVKKIQKEHFEIFSKNLLSMGYTKAVVKDEIQAYLMFGHSVDKFGKGVRLQIRTNYHDLFHQSLDKFFTK